MKRFLLLPFFIFAFVFSASAQYVTIPDATFRTILKGKFPSCFNASDMMDTTNALIVNAATLELSGYDPVNDWEGLQYFKNLQKAGFYMSHIATLPPMLPATLKQLIIDPAYPYTSDYTILPALPNGLTKFIWHFGEQVTSIPALPSTLTYMDIWYAETLTSVPALPNSITHLELRSCYVLQGVSSFPNSLTYLNYSASSPFITSVPALPNSIDTFQCASNAITSLPALPTALKYFNCYANQLTILPDIPATTEYINCVGNQLTALPVLPPALKYLDCRANLITSLPALPASVNYLDASHNSLSGLPTLPPGLIKLQAYENHITALPALPATLNFMYVYINKLTTLPTLPAGLDTLDCRGNKLTALPALPASLKILDCSGNHLHSLPALPQSLVYFSCGENSITTMPALPNSLTYLSCPTNNFTSLPALPSHLSEFYCNNNQLFTLPDLPSSLWRVYCYFNNLTCLPVLPGTNNADFIFDDKIHCTPNAVPHAGIRLMHANTTFTSYNSANPYPVCSVINNNNHCEVYPMMTGFVYYDNNHNNVRDIDEPTRKNVKVKLSNGSFTFTNNNGFYAIEADALGTYSTSIVAPAHFASTPSQYSYTFATYDTLVSRDFGCTPTESVDSVSISIFPYWTSEARPGFEFAYQVDYENAGSTTLSPGIVVNYDNSRLIYNSCDEPAVINTGNSLTLSESNLAPGTQKSFIGYFTVNPLAVIGDSIRGYAHITANAVAADDSSVVLIRGSFDPNDKTATPVLSPAQVINGNYIYYTIRFQNTGTDTAFSVVITDTLNSQLQAATIEMLGTSHPCKTTVKGKNISFEFINIMLPDSNISELKSHGYVRFRVKPLNTLVAGNTVPNKAAIYFDYNSPVITNNAITTIAEPIVVPLKLLSFTVSKGVGSTADLLWQSTNEVSVKNYEIEMSTNGRTFTNIGFENAKGNQYNSYTRSVIIPSNPVLYFRLKMTDIDGRFSYSNIAILRNDKTNTAFSFLNNPVKDELSISLLDESLKNTSATIFNAQGAVVKTILLQQDIENINVGSLPAGVYYMVTEKGNRQFVIIK